MGINTRFEPYAKFFIVRSSDNKAIESHQERAAAEHALVVLNEHEEKNGRGANYYRIEERGT